jgi:hypothetical protein
MPLSRIDFVQGKSAEYRRSIGDIVDEAMVDVLKAPRARRTCPCRSHTKDVMIDVRLSILTEAQHAFSQDFIDGGKACGVPQDSRRRRASGDGPLRTGVGRRRRCSIQPSVTSPAFSFSNIQSSSLPPGRRN